MKMKIKQMTMAVMTAVMIATSGVNSLPGNVITVQAASVRMNRSQLNLNKGRKATLNLEGATGTVSWKSTNKKVATVSASGKVITKNPGVARIIATCNGQQYVCVVTVKAPLKSISLDNESLTMEEGNTETLNVIYNPANTTVKKRVRWTSSNSAVAIVSDGDITAKGAGTATITAKVAGRTASCLVTVTADLKGISLSQSTLTIAKGATSISCFFIAI